MGRWSTTKRGSGARSERQYRKRGGIQRAKSKPDWIALSYFIRSGLSERERPIYLLSYRVETIARPISLSHHCHVARTNQSLFRLEESNFKEKQIKLDFLRGKRKKTCFFKISKMKKKARKLPHPDNKDNKRINLDLFDLFCFCFSNQGGSLMEVRFSWEQSKV